MQILDTPFPEVKIIQSNAHADERGLFVETWNRDYLDQLDKNLEWRQDSFSISIKKGTVRGLHFQAPPTDQYKLVRASKGSLFDVVVDIRHGSLTYGEHYSIVLKACDYQQLFIPSGFAHGFCTLEDNTEVTYKISGSYAPEQSGGIIWNDPDLGIDWPVSVSEAVLSEKDRTRPELKNSPIIFHYSKKLGLAQ
jgi:dTDP-4-dehydrorhamnose 3,5-epimerase